MNYKVKIIILAAFIFLTSCSAKNESVYKKNNIDELNIVSQKINTKLEQGMDAENVGITLIESLFTEGVWLHENEVEDMLTDLPDNIDEIRIGGRNSSKVPIDYRDIVYWEFIRMNGTDILQDFDPVYYLAKHTDWHFSNLSGNDDSERTYYDSYMIYAVTGPNTWHTMIIVDFGDADNASYVRKHIDPNSSVKFDDASIMSLSPMSMENKSSSLGFYYTGTSTESILNFYIIIEEMVDFSKLK